MEIIEVPLSQGKKALIDADDFELINQHKWYAQKGTRTYYAATKAIVNNKIRTVMMHRLILNMLESKLDCDHIDNNGLNNCRSNLRACTRSQNSMNRASHRGSSSKFKGVSRTTSAWSATIGLNGTTYCLGSFKTEIEAALAYNKAAEKHFKEFARLNIL